jgi:O-antigen/teichoic acid export membrane protein
MESRDHNNVTPSGGDLFKTLTGRLTSDTIRYIPAAIIPAGLSVAAASIFTRIFPPDEYGLYAITIAATAVVGSVLAGWMQQSVLRYLPRFKAEGRRSEFLAKLITLLFGVTLPVVLLLLAVHAAFADCLGVYRPFLVPAVLLVLTEVFFFNLVSVLQADLRSKTYSLFKVLNSISRLGLALAFVFLIRKDVVGLIVGAAAATALLVIPMMREINILRYLSAPHRYIDFGFVRMFAAYGPPMVGWILCGRILAISDRFILGAIKGSAEVGIYSANYNLVAMGFGLISAPLLTALYQLVMTAWETGEKKRTPEIITQFSRFYLLAVLPLVTFVAIFSRDIVSIVLGEEFREGYTIIPFVVGGIGLWGWRWWATRGSISARKPGRCCTWFSSVSPSTSAHCC